MSHAWRPLILVIGIVVLILIARAVIIPPDFKSVNGDYKYQWHRVSSENYWKDFKVKHKGRDFCKNCHSDKIEIVADSGHAKVQCENCHVLYEMEAEKKGHPAVDLKEYYDYPLEIGINSKRLLCQRCHTKLPYRPAVYLGFDKPRDFRMIDPDKHNPETECVECHDVHRTGFKCSRCHVKDPNKPPVFKDIVIPEYNPDSHKQKGADKQQCTNCHDGHKGGFKFKAKSPSDEGAKEQSPQSSAPQEQPKPTDQPSAQSATEGQPQNEGVSQSNQEGQ
jgi:hypothetical protein